MLHLKGSREHLKVELAKLLCNIIWMRRRRGYKATFYPMALINLHRIVLRKWLTLVASTSQFNHERMKAIVTKWQLLIMHLVQFTLNVKVNLKKKGGWTQKAWKTTAAKWKLLVSLVLFLFHRRKGSRGSRNKHATGCVPGEYLACLAASGHGFARVRQPWSCGPPCSSASGLAACFLALLSDARLVFWLREQKQSIKVHFKWSERIHLDCLAKLRTVWNYFKLKRLLSCWDFFF